MSSFSRLSTTLLVLSTLTVTLAVDSPAFGRELNQEPKPVVTAAEILGVAKAALHQETRDFNTLIRLELKEKSALRKAAQSYGREAKKFYRAAKLFQEIEIDEVDPSYLLDKCIFDLADLKNLQSRKLTLADDETYARNDRLSEVRELYGRQFYRVIHTLCVRGKERFERRLAQLVFAGSDYQLPAKDREMITELVFSPTLQGKVTFLETLEERHIGISVVGLGLAMGSLVGLNLPGLVVGLIYVADEAGSVFSSYRTWKPQLYLMHTSDSLEVAGVTGAPLAAKRMQVELTEEEATLAQQTQAGDEKQALE